MTVGAKRMLFGSPFNSPSKHGSPRSLMDRVLFGLVTLILHLTRAVLFSSVFGLTKNVRMTNSSPTFTLLASRKRGMVSEGVFHFRSQSVSGVTRSIAAKSFFVFLHSVSDQCFLSGTSHAESHALANSGIATRTAAISARTAAELNITPPSVVPNDPPKVA